MSIGWEHLLHGEQTSQLCDSMPPPPPPLRACRSTSAGASCKKQLGQQLEVGTRHSVLPQEICLPGPVPVVPPAGSGFTAGSALAAGERPVPGAGPAAPTPLPGGGTGGLTSAALSPAAAASATADPLLLPLLLALPLPAFSFTTGRRPLPFLPLPGGPLPLLLTVAAGASC